MREHLTDVETLTHPRYGTKAKLGQLPDSPWQVVLVNMGEGTLTAATLTERVLTWLEPEAVLLVGVAGGLKDDIGIGDVVVATKVYSVQGGKQTPDGFLVRPEAWRASHRLEQAAKEALGDTADFQAYFKPIAVGDVVLADRKSELARHIHAHYNDAVAIEMESSGVAHAVASRRRSGRVDHPRHQRQSRPGQVQGGQGGFATPGRNERGSGGRCRTPRTDPETGTRPGGHRPSGRSLSRLHLRRGPHRPPGKHVQRLLRREVGRTPSRRRGRAVTGTRGSGDSRGLLAQVVVLLAVGECGRWVVAVAGGGCDSGVVRGSARGVGVVGR